MLSAADEHPCPKKLGSALSGLQTPAYYEMLACSWDNKLDNACTGVQLNSLKTMLHVQESAQTNTQIWYRTVWYCTVHHLKNMP